MIRHVMLVEVKSGATSAEIEATKKAFIAIPDKVGGLENVEWGWNNSPEGKNQSYTLAIVMTFHDEQARDTYLVHPAHEALKVHFRKIIADIVVLDYTVE